jgi:hypothetical protein
MISIAEAAAPTPGYWMHEISGVAHDLFGFLTREGMERLICQLHYTHSVPSGKSYYYYYDGAIVVFAIPANPNVSTFLTGERNRVWDLARLWAPDGHRHNLLTQAIAVATKELRRLEPRCLALVSYADPDAGHMGGVYRAASWQYLGRTESRAWRTPNGQIIPRRKFHSGGSHINKSEIEALGYVEVRRAGKYRFVHGLTKRIRRRLAKLEAER